MASALSIPLPYSVPDITLDRVSYYFLGQTIGDAYRAAVNGDANWYAWIEAAATMDDAHFAAAFGPNTPASWRAAFRAAFQALQAPGGSAVAAPLVVHPDGSATPAPPPATAPTAQAVAPAPAPTSDAASLNNATVPLVSTQLVNPLALGGVAPAPDGMKPPAPTTTLDWKKLALWAVGLVIVLWLVAKLAR